MLKNTKKHPTLAKFCMTFAKKTLKSAKKCKNLQKTSFHPQKGRFFTTYTLYNRIFSPISRVTSNPFKS